MSNEDEEIVVIIGIPEDDGGGVDLAVGQTVGTVSRTVLELRSELSEIARNLSSVVDAMRDTATEMTLSEVTFEIGVDARGSFGLIASAEVGVQSSVSLKYEIPADRSARQSPNPSGFRGGS